MNRTPGRFSHGPTSKTLTADLTLYVRTDGSNNNTGLANTAAGAFLTAEYAVAVILNTMNGGGHTVTIKMGDGTYTIAAGNGIMVDRPFNGSIVIQGNTGNASAVILDGSTNSPTATLWATGGGVFTAEYLKLRSGALSAASLGAIVGGVVYFSNIVFGKATNNHVYANRAGYLEQTGNCQLDSEGVTSFTFAESTHHGDIRVGSVDLALLANITVTYFAYSSSLADITYTGSPTITLSGHTASGQRYMADTNSIIQAIGLGATFFPGNVAGSTATGAIYSA